MKSDFNGRNKRSLRSLKGTYYTRIEAEAGGAAWRIYPNDIRDNRRRDGREGERIVGAKRDKNKRPIAEIGHEGLIRLWPEPNKNLQK